MILTLIHIYIIQLTPLGAFHSVADYIKYRRYVLALTIYIYSFSSLFSELLILTQPVNLSLWEETGEPRENPRLSAEC